MSTQDNVAPGRDLYPYFERITLRYADNDTNGHVNNASYYSFFDTAVEGFLTHHQLRRTVTEQVRTLVVASSCRYFREVAFPGYIDVGVRIARMGNSSITWDLGVFTQDSDVTAAARGEFVIVCASPETGRPTSIPDVIREQLLKLSA
ncbi:acyl-CoA thioesterase [Orrella sp. 11846]|uniref:acyl-CoA thioesterase n=1 Tax=Orrella sp. 11846 TaxID=3409913 RepID=UPI003B5917B7